MKNRPEIEASTVARRKPGFYLRPVCHDPQLYEHVCACGFRVTARTEDAVRAGVVAHLNYEQGRTGAALIELIDG